LWIFTFNPFLEEAQLSLELRILKDSADMNCHKNLCILLLATVLVFGNQVLASRLLVDLPKVPEFPKPEPLPLPTVPSLPKPELPQLPKVELPPLPHIPTLPKPELPTLPHVAKPELPPSPKLEVPKLPELPPLPHLPELPKPTLPTIPSLPKDIPHSISNPWVPMLSI
jgi:hypothetical protein